MTHFSATILIITCEIAWKCEYEFKEYATGPIVYVVEAKAKTMHNGTGAKK